MRYFIHLNYRGANYHGWQIQTNSDTIQARLQEVLSTILRKPVEVTGCGRTDTGVHARSYYAHFDDDLEVNGELALRMNKMLPVDIGIYDIIKVGNEDHARFDAVNREYRYFIHFKKDAFLQDRSFWLHSYDLDLDLLNKAASVLLEYDDFRTFEKKGGGNKTSICKVSFAEWQVVDENQWVFVIKADRFLRNMVRRITGALLSIGIGHLTTEQMVKALMAGQSLEVQVAPPAHGLFLWDISYPASIIK